jgi:hypothetical protein
MCIEDPLTKSRLLAKGKSFSAFPWGLRAAGQTIGEVAVGVDFKMLDKYALFSEVCDANELTMK